LDEIEGFYPYSSVYVLDRDANVMARSSRSPPLSPVLTEICRKVAATGASRIDLVGKAPGETLIGFGVAVVPAPGTPGASPTPVRALGVALVVFDASHTLFPRVTREVVPARTGETLLVRHEGNDMVYFSPLRHVPPGSPNLRFPLSTAPTPASLALEGHETFVEYRDYRGVPVLAATHDFLFCRGEFANRSFDHPPRLVLLDLKLPKVDGLEVLRTVKGDPRTQAIPVVVLTSSREENDLVEGYKLGVNAYIQKPVEFDSFRQAVKQLGLFWLVVNEPPPPTAFRP
jgi:CheY-like chemotaxis protein